MSDTNKNNNNDDKVDAHKHQDKKNPQKKWTESIQSKHKESTVHPHAPSEADITNMSDLEQKDAEIHKLTLQLQRELASRINHEKQLEKEKEDFKKFAISNFARSICDVDITFFHAMNSFDTDRIDEPMPLPDKHSDEDLAAQYKKLYKATCTTNKLMKNLYNGCQMIYSMFEQKLKEHGIQRIVPLHKNVDPKFHEITQAEPSEKHAKNIIIKVLQPGYVLNGRIIKAAQVIVSSGASAK